MKPWIKYLLIPVLVLLSIYLLLCAMGPKNMDVSHETKINAPAPVVFNLINSLPRTEYWNPWLAMDTSMTTTYSGPAEGVGSRSEWQSASMGAGWQEIVESVQNERVKTALAFEPDLDDINHAEYIITPDGDGVKTTWTFESSGDVPFLGRGFMYIMGFKKMMHTAYTSGLANIKKIAEQRARDKIYNGYTMSEQELPVRYFVSNRDVVPTEGVQQFYIANLPSLYTKVLGAGVELDGMPCGLFYDRNIKGSKTDMAAAIPVKEPISIQNTTTITLPARRALVVDYYGDMAHTQSAHLAIEEYMRDYGLFDDKPVIEEYMTDPTTEKDPSKWLTKIIYYLAE